MKKLRVQWLLLFIVLGALGGYLLARLEILNVIRGVNLYNMAALAAIACLFLLSNSLILKTLLSAFNVHVSVGECFGVSSFGAMLNYWTSFGGGTFSKAIYLKRRYAFSYHAFLASMSSTHIIDFLWVSLLGCIMLILTGGIWEYWGQVFFTGFFLLGLLALMLIKFPFVFESKAVKFFKGFGNVFEGWKILKEDKALIYKISLLLLANHILAAVELLLAYAAFSINIGVIDAVLLGMISTLAMLIKLTPANLGIQETILASSSHFMGIGFEEGLLAVGLLRVVSVIVIFLIGGGFSLKMTENK